MVLGVSVLNSSWVPNDPKVIIRVTRTYYLTVFVPVFFSVENNSLHFFNNNQISLKLQNLMKFIMIILLDVIFVKKIFFILLKFWKYIKFIHFKCDQFRLTGLLGFQKTINWFKNIKSIGFFLLRIIKVKHSALSLDEFSGILIIIDWYY